MKISAEEYLKTLTEKSVWVFTKQKVSSFDEIIKVTNLFDSIPNRETTNIEEFFSKNHLDFDVETDRHRTLVIPQFFGLITKTPFYKRGGQYNKERTTAIYDKLKSINPLINKYEFNKIITEQVLKLKIHAIIDTENNNEDYYILPVIFIYKVLKELQQKYGINEVSIDHLYTYIMTCKEYNQWEQAVEYISQNSPISEYVPYYKDYSRIMSLIRNNTRLFIIDSKSISINPKFDNYFYNNFFIKYDIEEMNEILYRDVDYSYFLYNVQDFGINLIDEPKVDEVIETIEVNPNGDLVKVLTEEKEIIDIENSEEEKDDKYLEKIDNIKEENVNTDVAIGAHKVAPAQIEKGKISKKYKRNPLLGRIAIQNAYYCCEHNARHETFTSAKTNKNFMEAHHLVPVKYQQEVWEKYHINVDCVENILSLCPNCHRAFHNGTDKVKIEMIEKMYEKLLPRYKSIDFNITVDEIKKFYNIKNNY